VKSKELIKKLEKAGWELERVRGSHHIFKHPDHERPIPVPQPKKDLPKGTTNQILKQAGLK